MGWLRDFMAQAGLRSFGELARQALSHPEWPEDTRAQTRSLEAILGRLDRLEDVDWLADRPGVQQILASVLRVSVAEIRTILVGSVSLRPTTTRIRLDDLGVARSLNLLDEPLPPGIPERISLPASWARCCWTGAAGSGFSLAAHWLAARGLAHTDKLESLEELERLPVVGPPLYVEVEARLLVPFLESFRGSQPFCVAAAAPLPKVLLRGLARPVESIQSPPVEESLEPIVDWILARVTARKEFGRQYLLDWLRAVPLKWKILETLADVLGVVGACLDGSIDPAHGVTKEGVLRQWMEHRTEDLARERHRDTLSLRRTLPSVLVEMAQTVLTDETRPLQDARGIDEWLDLVPEQHRRGPDIDWLTTRLVSENLPMRKPDLERAAQRLPPGAHRIVVALRETHILKPTSVTRFALRPHFLARLAHEVAKDHVAASSPLFWGEALLRPFARQAILESLAGRADAQPESLAEDVLEQVDLESPALVCAFETSFVALGLASLAGGEIPDQTAAQLLVEQAALVVHPSGPLPCARTLPSEPSDLADLPGAFLLAAWSLGEAAGERRMALPAMLDPWHAGNVPEGWEAALDRVVETIRAALTRPPAWLAGAIRLLDRLRHCVGTQAENSALPHPLFLVGSCLDAAELGVLEWSSVEEILRVPWQTEFFRIATQHRRTLPSQLAQTVLYAWVEAGHPDSGSALFSSWETELVQVADAEVLLQCLLYSGTEFSSTAIARLAPAVWQAWIGQRRREQLESEPVRPWELAPESALATALGERPPILDPIREIVWRRHPELAMRQIDRHRTVAPGLAADWLKLAPSSLAPTIAQHAQASGWLRAADVLTSCLERAMYVAVASRIEGWPTAYECMNQIEREKRRFAET